MQIKGIEEDISLFFDLKNKLISDLEMIEKKVFDLSKDILESEKTINKMLLLTNTKHSPYFLIRMKRLSGQYKEFVKQKKYSRKDFDLMYSLIQKLKNTDKVELLNNALQNRLDKIARREQGLIKDYSGFQESYLTYHYHGVNFIVRNYPKKLLNSKNPNKKTVKIQGVLYPIFPGNNFNMEEDNSFPGDEYKLLILNSGKSFFCLRYDEIGDSISFSPDTFRKKLKPSGSTKWKFLKYKNIRYHYIDESTFDLV